MSNLPAIRFGVKARIVSFNARDFYAKTGKKVPDITYVQQIVEQLDPDVFLLQEADRSTIERLNRNLSHPFETIVVFPTNDSDGRSIAILLQSGVELKNHYSYAHLTTPNGLPTFSKNLGVAKLYWADGHYTLTLLNGHFKANSAKKSRLAPTGLSGEDYTFPVREREARATQSIVAKLMDKAANAQVLLMGDLNALSNTEKGQAILQMVKGGGLTDLLYSRWGRYFPTHLNGTLNTRDYALGSQGLKRRVISAYVAGNHSMEPYSKASDHLPLVVDIETNAAKLNTLG